MFNNAPELTIERGNHSRLLLALAIAVSSLIALIGSLSFLSIKAGLSIVTAWTALIWICIYCLRKRFDRVVMAWLVVFPFCYYFFSFPRERSVFTVDRAFLLLVVLTLISAHRSQGVLPLRADVRLAAYLWAAYLSVCFVSLFGSSCLRHSGLLSPHPGRHVAAGAPRSVCDQVFPDSRQSETTSHLHMHPNVEASQP